MSIMEYAHGISQFRRMCEDNKGWLQHVAPDADGLYNGMTLPPSHSRVILYLSSMSLATGLYALSREYYDLAAVPFIVFVTSLTIEEQ
jgi:hypothetical protein